jgi:hypothetical protein
LFEKKERTTTVTEFVFEDITRKEAPVRVGAKRYVLLEATGDAAFRWRNACAKAAKMSGGKVTGVGDIADTEALLVSYCLYEVDEQGRWRAMTDGTPDPHYQVNVQVIRAWPYRCIKPLFDWVRQNSALEERETKESLLEKRRELEEQLEAFSNGEDPLKNSSPAPAAGSA